MFVYEGENTPINPSLSIQGGLMGYKTNNVATKMASVKLKNEFYEEQFILFGAGPHELYMSAKFLMFLIRAHFWFGTLWVVHLCENMNIHYTFLSW